MQQHFGWAFTYPFLRIIGEIFYYSVIAVAVIVFLYLLAGKWFSLGYPKKRVMLFTGIFVISCAPLIYMGSRAVGMFYRPPGEWGVDLLIESILYGTSHTFHGGLVMPLVFLVFLSCLFRFRVLEMLDAVFLYVPIAHGIGRLGCLVAGCCRGRYVSLNIGDVSIGFQNPVPLYAIAVNVLIFLFLRRLHTRVYDDSRTRALFGGSVAAFYLVLYAPARFVLEMFRTEPVIFNGLTQAQIAMSIFLLTGTLVFMVIGYRCFKTRPVSEKKPV